LPPDRQGKGLQTRRFYLRKGDNLDADVVAELGETNTGDPAVLTDFATWAITTYPAQRYMLVIWNHGSGWDDSDIYEAARDEASLNITHRSRTLQPANDVAQGDVSLVACGASAVVASAARYFARPSLNHSAPAPSPSMTTPWTSSTISISNVA
jgi:hypothetical protein